MSRSSGLWARRSRPGGGTWPVQDPVEERNSVAEARMSRTEAARPPRQDPIPAINPSQSRMLVFPGTSSENHGNHENLPAFFDRARAANVTAGNRLFKPVLKSKALCCYFIPLVEWKETTQQGFLHPPQARSWRNCYWPLILASPKGQSALLPYPPSSGKKDLVRTPPSPTSLAQQTQLAGLPNQSRGPGCCVFLIILRARKR